jgi:hypothetical protein
MNGPSIKIAIVNKNTDASYILHALLDSGSRETVISSALVNHLVVRGVSRVASEKKLRECELFEFVLPEDTVVRPIDRVHLIAITEGDLSAHEVFSFVLQSDEEYLIIGTRDMNRCNLLRYLTAAIQAVESDNEESNTSVIGHDHIHRTTGSDVTPNGDTHTKVEDNMSAEECTAEHNDEVSLMKQTSSHSDELRLSSKSGAVESLRRVPYLRPQGLTSQEQR